MNNTFESMSSAEEVKMIIQESTIKKKPQEVFLEKSVLFC